MTVGELKTILNNFGADHKEVVILRRRSKRYWLAIEIEKVFDGNDSGLFPKQSADDFIGKIVID